MKLPKQVRSSVGRTRYVAHLVEQSGEHAIWSIFRQDSCGDRRVGKMHDGPRGYYGQWGSPTCTLRELVWAGPTPDEYPKSPDPDGGTSALGFDLSGPFKSYQHAIDTFADHADRLIAWRHRHLIRKYIEALDFFRTTNEDSTKLDQAENALRAILLTGTSSHLPKEKTET